MTYRAGTSTHREAPTDSSSVYVLACCERDALPSVTESDVFRKAREWFGDVGQAFLGRSWPRRNLILYETGADLLRSLAVIPKDVEHVYLTRLGGVSLTSFQHPSNAVYILGPDFGDGLSGAGSRVTVETASGSQETWSHAILAITLHHRLMECNNGHHR